MKNENWNKVERIFHSALDLSVEERTFFLQKECRGDGKLLSEVETLLESFEHESGFLDEPVFEIGLGAIHQKSKKNLAGSVIGFYELKEKIGVGGMGEVYKAVDTRLNRAVALKFLSETLENDNSAKRQLIKEAQAVAMLEHSNICAVHGIEQMDEHHFIVMQFVEGITLAEKIETQPVGVEEFKSLAKQILTAVAFAHSHGVIHRDLKPGNIMLTGDGQIKVLDFGLAKVLPQKQIFGRETTNESSQFSNNGLIIGTVSYMSPEQLRGERLDYRSDIFSVGIILYELIAGQNPFNHKSQAETIAAILGENQPALKEFAPDFPESLKNLVARCLQKKPEQRFQSAAEILVKLDSAERENYVETVKKRRAGFFIKTALAAVILLVVLSFLFFYHGKNQQRTLAVLPITMENVPADKEYLADGLTQSIIEKLSNLSELKVKNQSVINSYKGKTVEPQTVGKELNADAVFTGTIQKRGDDLILVTKLIRTSDGFVINPNESKIEESNLTELTENLSLLIVSKIKLNLTDEDKTKLAKKDTSNEEAKKLYFLGRYFLNRRTGEDVNNAVRSFSTAKELDPYFAKAWAGLADSYISLSAPGVEQAISPKEAAGYAKSAAKKALEIDDTLSESYNSLGLISSKYEWNWSEAEGYYRTAISRDMEFIPAHIGLISVLNTQGRFDEAMEEAQKVKEIDPSSNLSELEIAKIYYRKKDFEQMEKILNDLLKRNPTNSRIAYIQSYLFLSTGRYNEAIALLEKINGSGKISDQIFAAAPLGFGYAKIGRRDEALKIIANLGALAKNYYIPAQEKAVVYVGLGDYDKAFENLNLSCKEKYSTLPLWVTDPLVDQIKSDIRFADIKKCVNL